MIFSNSLPPLLSNVTVYVLASQLAVAIKSPSTISVSSNLLKSSLYHPLNVYPLFSGTSNVPYSVSNITFFVAVSSAIVQLFWLVKFPPFASKVNVYIIAVYWAYNVWLLANFNSVDISILEPPAVYQPLKIYPLLLTIGNSP